MSDGPVDPAGRLCVTDRKANQVYRLAADGSSRTGIAGTGASGGGGDNYLARIFGRRNVVQVDRLERLPEKLPLLYFRLAG